LNETEGLRNQAAHSPPRWFLPLVVGVITFAFVWVGQAPPGVYGDFDYLWGAGQAVWHGQNPYAVIQAHVGAGSLRSPYYYPATAAVLMAPFGALPRHLAVSLFTALGMALICLSVSGWRMWIVVSPPAIQAVLFGQWSPWLTAAIGLPWLGFVWAAKPTIGLALFGAWPSRMALYGGLAVVTLTFLLLPTWPSDWFTALRGAPHYTAPMLRPGGFLLLLAFLRWRQPEARMLGLLALIPHTTGLYEQLPLLLIPQTRPRFAMLMGGMYLAALLVYAVLPESVGATIEARVQMGLERQWPYFLALVYLPALYLVLRPQAGGREASTSQT
jgi:hypothetical protein